MKTTIEAAGKWTAHPVSGGVADLRRIALRGLGRMYRPEAGLFPFRVRRAGEGIVSEGKSLRYTAIALIGLAGEEPTVVSGVLAGGNMTDVCGRLVDGIRGSENLGDTALVFWACCAAGDPGRSGVLNQLVRMNPAGRSYPAVEIAWALAALCNDPDLRSGGLRRELARRLVAAFDDRSGCFPHRLGESGVGPRSHVSCFADMVYPIHALALHYGLSGDRAALAAADRCAEQICGKQGPDGQWWWHYDVRTGEVVERYPVYAVHQDAMAPMALFALREAGGTDFGPYVSRGLAWLESSPELRGGSLIDAQADIVWRKVARREPRKLIRYAQALATRVHPGFRIPGVDWLFPPVSVDYEDRPYHLGWLLHAFTRDRVERQGGGGEW